MVRKTLNSYINTTNTNTTNSSTNTNQPSTSLPIQPSYSMTNQSIFPPVQQSLQSQSSPVLPQAKPNQPPPPPPPPQYQHQNFYNFSQSNFRVNPLPFPNISNFVCNKLDGSNFLVWKYQLSSILISRNLFGFVDGSIPTESPFLMHNNIPVNNPVFA